jgi:hypothetical protein
MSTLSKFSRINFEEWGGTATVDGGGTPIMTLDYNDKINFALYTVAPSSNPILRVNNFPRYTGFNNKVFTYTLGIKQGATPVVPTFSYVTDDATVTFVSGISLYWPGGSAPTGNADKWDFFNFILINTGKAGVPTDGSNSFAYDCFANLNGNYSI